MQKEQEPRNCLYLIQKRLVDYYQDCFLFMMSDLNTEKTERFILFKPF